MKRNRLPRLVHNWISTLGILVALIAAMFMTFLYVIGIYAEQTNPYLGILIYMVMPPFLIVGLLLVPIGMYRKWKCMKKTGEEHYPSWPYIDLNKRSHRNATIIFIIGTAFFVIVGAVGSYEAYHFTESITFCGRVCHEVMKPEHVAYQNSPHARVACVSCHVGPGADWFAKSKLSGLYQVYAVTANTYPQPIPTPIEQLRPAQETCEQCHWPEKFFGAQQRQFNHYMYDQENSPWPINILIKTGGGDPRTGQTAGIHWHMNIGVRVEYIARDERRQDIPWVRVKDYQTGRTTVYQDSENPLTPEEIQSAETRVMDCMDCHNRPSHIFNSPDFAIDRAILTGKIDRTIPEIKRIAVEAMDAEYSSEEEALQLIANYITGFYRSTYPGTYKNRREDINAAILATQEAFSQNIFPEMKVRWSEYPANIGHFTSPGCMRCHAGNLENDEGLTITRECTICHAILSQGGGERAEEASTQEGLEFAHPDPEDIDEAWQEMGCYECHAGVQP